MSTTVQKWGNSLAIRIPSIIAEQMNIQQGMELELCIDGQGLLLLPKKRKPTLEELLENATPEKRHSEINFGIHFFAETKPLYPYPLRSYDHREYGLFIS